MAFYAIQQQIVRIFAFGAISAGLIKLLIGKKNAKVYDILYDYDNFYIKRKNERYEKLLNGTFGLRDDSIDFRQSSFININLKNLQHSLE